MKKRVLVSKAVIESPSESLEVVENLGNTKSHDGWRQFEFDYILQNFEQDVRERGGYISPADMHHCLSTVIRGAVDARDENPQWGLVRGGLKDPDAVGYVAISTEGARIWFVLIYPQGIVMT